MNAVYDKFIALLWRGMSLPADDACLAEPMDEQEWATVYLLSMRQAVVGIVWSGVETLPPSCRPPVPMAEHWAEAVKVTGNDYDRVARVVEQQGRTWASEGINAVLLKGPVSAAMYPDPRRRTSGDIDWWMPTDKDWDAALKIVESKGFRWTGDSDGDIHYVVSGIVVEHHRRGLEYEGPIGELLLRCEHALHHAMVTGMGFRHLCDYLMALKYYEGQYDVDGYHKVLQDRGLLKWEKALSGLDPRLVSLVFKDGNMGFGRSRRFSGGFFSRAALFLQLCPGLFVKRWSGLIVGRLRKNS